MMTPHEMTPSQRPLLPTPILGQDEKSLLNNEPLQKIFAELVRKVIQEDKRVEEMAPSPSGTTTTTTTSSTVPVAVNSVEREKITSPPRKTFRSSPERGKQRRDYNYSREYKDSEFKKRYRHDEKVQDFNKKDRRDNRSFSHWEKNREFKKSNDGFGKRNDNGPRHQTQPTTQSSRSSNTQKISQSHENQPACWDPKNSKWGETDDTQIMPKKREEETVVSPDLKSVEEKEKDQKKKDSITTTPSLEEKDESQEKKEIKDKNYLGFQHLPLQEGVIQMTK
jgi:hypothetical protein